MTEKNCLTSLRNLNSKSQNLKIVLIINNKKLITSLSLSEILLKTAINRSFLLRLKSQQKSLIKSYPNKSLKIAQCTKSNNQDQALMSL